MDEIDAKRWRFAVKHNCFPVIAQDGETWVVWGRSRDWKRRTFMGKSPDEAIDAAMAAHADRSSS